ncbi:MAG: malectin domain-containing carbohydrate-binding protein [Gemmataceae bacterium]
MTPTQFFTDVQGRYNLTDRGDSVSIGFVPDSGNEADFKSLLQITVDGNQSYFELDPSSATFATFGDTTMSLVVVEGNGPNQPLPIYKQVQDLEVDFNIATMLGFGQSIDQSNSQPFTVADWVDFQLNGLALTPGDGTTGPRVGMQGTGKLSKGDGVDLSTVGFLKDLVVTVGGTNYVWADKTGITATGFTGELDFSTSDKAYTVGGYTVTGDVKVGYSDPGDGTRRISIGGGATLTPPAGETFKLENVAGAIQVSLGSENGAPKFYGLTLELDGTFTAGGLTVKTVDGFGFSYNFDGPQWEIFGGVDFTIKDKAEVVVLLGTESAPGLVIKDGALQKFNGTINADFTLGPVVVTTSPSNGLNFAYDRDKGQFEMSGGLGLKIGADEKQFTLNATLGDATDPGIIYIPSKGGLQQANFGITGQLTVGSLSFTARDAGFRWVQATATTSETWEIHGGFGVDFGAFEASVALGTTANPGIVVDADGFRLDGITVELENVRLGPLYLKELEVSYTKETVGYDVDVVLKVVVLDKFEVDGELILIDGKVDTVSLGYKNVTGIPIGETGIKLTELSATVKNIERPADIVVVGTIGVIYGETINIGGKQGNLFHARGTVTADADELIIDCRAELGAYTTDGGDTYTGVLGTVDGKLDLNWHTQVYSLHVEADGVLGVFDFEGDLLLRYGKDIEFLATADVVVPTWVPFIGGQELGGVGFYFQHVWAQPALSIDTSTTFAAWLDFDLGTQVTVGFEVRFDAAGNANWGLIGADQVTGFRQTLLNPGPTTYTYTTDLAGVVPAGATSLLVKADWSNPLPGVSIDGQPKLRVQYTPASGDPVIYTEDQFAAHSITVVHDGRLTNETSATVQISSQSADPYQPLPGSYAVLVDLVAVTNPFPNQLPVVVTSHTPKPIFGPVGGKAPVLPPVPTGPADTFPVTLTGNADEAYLDQTTVSIYRISSVDPFRRPVLVGKVNATQTGGSGWKASVPVPVDGLAAIPYTLVAVVNDGQNPPVASAESAPFTPKFAVRGTVLDQNGKPVIGEPVFLDYNRNGQQDDNEPRALTGPDGFAFTGTFAPNPVDPTKGWNPVPTNAKFDVVLDLNAPGDYAPITATQAVTFDGTTEIVQPYTLNAKTVIRGSLFQDTNGNGIAAAGQGLPQATAYLDTNNNGVRDAGEPTAQTDAGGGYAFRGLDAGTYTVRIDPATIGRGAAAPAYVVPAGTPGNTQPGAPPYTYGMAFTANRPVQITSLGVFDDNSDGLSTTLTAVLYNAATKVELARLTFTPTAPGTLVGGTRYLDLPSPIILPPGFQGLIVAYGFGQTADRAANVFHLPSGATPPWTTDAGAGRLTFGRGVYAPTPNTYPTIGDASALANPYAAGSFLYRDVAWAPSPASETSHTVTLDGSGFDPVGGQDFGLLPPSVLFGTVTGNPQAGGKVLPTASPRANWAVGLVADRVAVAINAGGAIGNGFVADGYFDAGQTTSTTTPIDTSRLANPAAVATYQSARVGANGGGFTYSIPGLNPGASYTVRLHFAEIVYQVTGQRQFDVDINGTRVLTDFDIVDAAGGPNTAYARDFPATADGLGRIVLAFTVGQADVPLVNAIQILSPATVAAAPKLFIDSGGPAWGDGSIADTYFTGGVTGNVGNYFVDYYSRTLTPVTEPQYQTYRASATANHGDGFTYTLPGFVAGRSYTVRLQFADFTYDYAGGRKFNVDINGRRVLTDFDIFAATGNWFTGYSADFDATADAQGRIVVAFTNGSAGVAQVNAIQVFEPAGLIDTATTDVEGNYALVGYGAGQYTVVQSPPPGWEQTAPFFSTPTFTSTPLAPTTDGTLLAGQPTDTLHTADFDGDGRLDVLVFGQTPGQAVDSYAYVLFNRPDGSFQTAAGAGGVELYAGRGTPAPVPVGAVGDFNGDHRPDIAIAWSTYGDANSNGIDVFLNTGDPTNLFTYIPSYWATQMPGRAGGEVFSSIAVGDLNKDGLDDVVLGQSTDPGPPARMVYAQNAATAGNRLVNYFDLPQAGQYYPSQGGNYPPPYAAEKITIADMNGDGNLDVMLMATVPVRDTNPPFDYQTYGANYGTARLVLARGNGAGGWISIYTDINPWGFGQVTGLAVGSVQIGQPPQVYAGLSTYFVNTSVNPSQRNNINFPSYAVGSNQGWYFTPSGVDLFDQGQERQTAANPRFQSGLRLADVNGDGLPDLINLLAPTIATQAIAIRLNTGSGFDFGTPPTLLPLPSNLTDWVGDFAIADFTGDGRPDIFVPATGVLGQSVQPGVLFRNETPQSQPGHSQYFKAGAAVTGLDFQSVQSGGVSAVRGRVFEDVGRNGVRDTGDAVRTGETVFLDRNRNGRLDPGEPTTTTGPGGVFSFPGLADGTYRVGVVVNDGWRPTGPGAEFADVSVTGGVATAAEIGLARRLVSAVPDQDARVGQPVTVALPQTAAAAGRRLLFTAEGTVPAGLVVDPATGQISWTPAPGDVGTHTITVRARDPIDPLFTETVPVTVRVAAPVSPPVVPPVVVSRIAVGGANGAVRTFTPDGAPKLTLTPFGDFAGEVRVASGDVTGDGVADLIAAAGPGGGPHVKVFDGATGAELATFFAFEPEFRGGLFVAAGDVDGDGVVDVVVGAGAGGGPRVRVFSGRDRSVLADFFAYDPGFRGGVTVAAGDVNGDGIADLVVGAGAGGGPHVRVIDGRTRADVSSFFAFDPAFTGGVFVAAGDLDGDGRADVVAGAGAGGGPRVRAVSGGDLAAGRPAGMLTDFLSGEAADRDGVRVAVTPPGANTLATLVAGSANRGRVKAYRPTRPAAELFELDVFADVSAGVFVG